MAGRRDDNGRMAELLGQDARAGEARMLPDTGPLTREQREAALTEIQAYRTEQGVSVAQISRETAIKSGTLGSVLKGTYQGHIDDYLRRVWQWMERRRRAAGKPGLPTGFVGTRLVDQMLGVIDHAHHTRSMAAIVGPSGTSKSMVCKACVTKFPGAIHYEATFGERSPGAMVGQLYRLLAPGGRAWAKGTIATRTRDIIDALADSGRLLLIDECHYLSREALQVLRDIHKQAGVPVVLVGTSDVLELIDDFSAFQGQFKRLFSMVLNITEEAMATGDPLYTTDEVVRFISAMGLRLTADGADTLTDLCNVLGWGGLGQARMLAIMASKITDARSGRAVSSKDLTSALRQMEGVTGFERTKHRRDQGYRLAASA